MYTYDVSPVARRLTAQELNLLRRWKQELPLLLVAPVQNTWIGVSACTQQCQCKQCECLTFVSYSRKNWEC